MPLDDAGRHEETMVRLKAIELQLRTLNGKVAQHEEYVTEARLKAARQEGIESVRSQTILTSGQLAKIGTIAGVIAALAGIAARFAA